ncbi:FAD/NAD(P)-binding protein [Corynebacterium frankenforstense]|uniref:FAD/NAD(P)-binding protein n=1 Tax=Corynebacterium TaxID=1716 RepID=UPI00254FF8EE|nr:MULTISPECIES: FAD/NAD(P)-binding protein [Corynebacterium]MDK6260637.1 FAD/NAD(P)-binding protein [Corynebacterium frankenforstense]MDK8895551.1 FAD/NAD(P)-binding protein [Corynebacterium sp. MSK006]
MTKEHAADDAAAPGIAIIGAGPRGISVIERIAANPPKNFTFIHLIDDVVFYGGRIWNPDQGQTLCMNTLAGAVTLFTEPGSSVGNPVQEGPTLFEWIRLVRGETEGISAEKQRLFRLNPVRPTQLAEFREEIDATVEQSHPTRALYGLYITWFAEVAEMLLPPEVSVWRHPGRVVEVIADEDNGIDWLRLDNGELIRADATVIAPGWVQPGPTAEEEALAAAVAEHPGLTWVRPDNPIDQNLDAVPECGDVIVRGLGMGFFDAMALLTIGRGGRFLEDDSARSGLRYEPSGREPHLWVSSRRGYPYVPKSDYGSLPPKASLERLRAVINELSGRDSVDFTAEVWPAIVRDAHAAYYRTLAATRPGAIDTGLDSLIGLIDATPVDRLEDTLAGHVAEKDLFRLSAWFEPLAGVSGTPEEVTETIAGFLARDIAEAVDAWDSPLKAGLWSISASRKPSAILGDQGVYTAESRRTTLSAFMALGQMVGSGPPLFRTRELLALIDAGLVTLLGAEPTVTVSQGAHAAAGAASSSDAHFTVVSPTTGTPVRATTLVDAWMHKPVIQRATDKLSRSIEAAGRWRAFDNHTSDGQAVPTGSPEVDPETRALVHPDGTPDARLMLLGIPTYGQMADTTISPMPGTDPLMLQETDKAARHAVEVFLSGPSTRLVDVPRSL